jgi:hypothetical protein
MKNKIIILFHFYQPPIQKTDILEEVIRDSYEPFLDMLNSLDNINVLANIQGCLIDRLLSSNRRDIIDKMKNLVISNKMQVTESLKYHAIAPYIPEELFDQQVLLNRETIHANLGINPINLFYPPELFINSDIINRLSSKFGINNVVSSKNINLKVIEEKGLDKGYVYRDSNLVIRDDYLSTLFTLPLDFNTDDINEFISKYIFTKDLTFLVFDVELFGHHFKNRLNFIKEFLVNYKDLIVPFSKSMLSSDKVVFDSVNESSWESEIVKRKLFDKRWKYKSNPIHMYHWKLYNLVLKGIKHSENLNYDVSFLKEKINFWSYSCQFWWASAYPFWHPGNVMEGASGILSLFYQIPDKGFFDKYKSKTLFYYSKIVDNLLLWERVGLKDDYINQYDKKLNSLIKKYENDIYIK